MPDSAAKKADALPPPDPPVQKGTLRGGHDPVEMARRSAEVRRAKRERSAAESVVATPTGVELASIPGLVERLGRILKDPQARDADVISAVRALADMAAGGGSTMPTSAARVQALSTDGLHALVRHLEVAHPWPMDPEPAQVLA